MKKLFVVIALLSSLFLVGCTERNREPVVYDNALFSEIMEKLMNDHYRQPTEEELWLGAINGLINSLDDPFSRYYTEEEYEQFRSSLGESFVGIGVTVENIDNQVVVRNVFPGSPAEQADIRAGDVLRCVDDYECPRMSYFEVLGAIPGEEGTTVMVGVSRSGLSDILFLEMTRARIQNPSVSHEVIEMDGQTLGYLKINSFGEETLNLVFAALGIFEDDHDIDGLVIDLRNNGGGYLGTVRGMLDLFLTESDLPMFSIESFRGGEQSIDDYNATGTERKNYDIVTLVNQYSASASEVFAAAMMEHGGYTVIGTESYGKGTMQVSNSLYFGGSDQLHLTQGRWLTPTGNWIHFDGGDFSGVMPTIEVLPSRYFMTNQVYLETDEVLMYDTVSNKIANAQVILNALGYEVRSDGYYDTATRDAIMAIQEAENITVTGNIGSDTARFLSDEMLAYRNVLANDIQVQSAFEYLLNGDE